MNIFKRNNTYSISEITPEIITRWKEQYSDIFEINVGDKTGYFRNITTSEIKSRHLTKVFNKDQFKTAINTLKLTWLGGDDDILKNPDFAVAAFNQLQPVFEEKIRKVLPNMKF